jgi:uncharacterized repeat protein (TIGR03803 family)
MNSKIGGFGVYALALAVFLVCFAQVAGSQTLTVSYSFGAHSNDGDRRMAGVIRDSMGNLYGTTNIGGTHGYGSVFKLTSSNKESVLYSFTGGVDGSFPNAALIRDSAGNLYGTTAEGGIYGAGTVFKLDPTGKETVLHSFSGKPTDGLFPTGLLRDSIGNFYGTTFEGGANNAGTIYKLDGSDVETVLYSFTGTGSDQGYPNAALALDGAGNLCGATQGPGPNTGVYGTVFKVDPSGNQTVLYTFTGGADGGVPNGGVVRDMSGNLYGVTTLGGNGSGGGGFGVVFKVDTSGTETVLHTFSGSDGQYPVGPLTRDSSGNLYGTTGNGGEYGWGEVFRIDTANNETVLDSFNGNTLGKYPNGGLARDYAGNLYGTTETAGGHDKGVVFKVTP